jgi:hypothetical protein
MGTHGTSTWIPRATSCWWKASYTGKNGKKHELLVKADGTETKEWQDHTRFSAAGVCFWPGGAALGRLPYTLLQAGKSKWKSQGEAFTHTYATVMEAI